MLHKQDKIFETEEVNEIQFVGQPSGVTAGRPVQPEVTDLAGPVQQQAAELAGGDLVLAQAQGTQPRLQPIVRTAPGHIVRATPRQRTTDTKDDDPT